MAKPLLKPEGFMTEAAFRELVTRLGVIIPAHTERMRQKPEPHVAIKFFLQTAAPNSRQARLNVSIPRQLGSDERMTTHFIPYSKIVRALHKLGLL